MLPPVRRYRMRRRNENTTGVAKKTKNPRVNRPMECWPDPGMKKSGTCQMPQMSPVNPAVFENAYLPIMESVKNPLHPGSSETGPRRSVKKRIRTRFIGEDPALSHSNATGFPSPRITLMVRARKHNYRNCHIPQALFWHSVYPAQECISFRWAVNERHHDCAGYRWSKDPCHVQKICQGRCGG